MKHSARLSNSFSGDWEVYVVSSAVPSLKWPEHDFGRGAPVPTLAERIEALAGLGYEPADGTTWQWQELVSGTTARVRLLATLDVRPIGGAS